MPDAANDSAVKETAVQHSPHLERGLSGNFAATPGA
jgi:hypothetical protein